MGFGYTHDEQILRIFAGNELADKIIAMQKAIYLALDATEKDTSKAPEAFDYLKTRYGIGNGYTWMQIASPKSVSDHQYYSHLGWDRDYTVDLVPEQQTMDYVNQNNRRFSLKKKILTSVSKALFPRLPPAKINSLAALFYYLHILDDYRFNEKGKHLMPLDELPAELIKHLDILFNGNISALVTVINSNFEGIRPGNRADKIENVLNALYPEVNILINSIGLTPQVSQAA